jgi:nicotinamidase/pyrazinamidase
MNSPDLNISFTQQAHGGDLNSHSEAKLRVLLIVDAQNDFMPDGALPVPDGDQIVPVINQLISSGHYDLVIRTRDWHPENHVSFSDNHKDAVPFSTIVGDSGQTYQVFPRHCIAGTRGAEIHPDLSPRCDYEILKGQDPERECFSAFRDTRGERDTELKSILDAELYRRGFLTQDLELTVTGLALNICVAATLRDAHALGIRSVLAVDASRSVGITAPQEFDLLRELEGAHNVRITSSIDIFRERALMQSLSPNRLHEIPMSP